MKIAAVLGAIALAFAAAPAGAAVLDAQANGFVVEQKVVINAPAAKVWASTVGLLTATARLSNWSWGTASHRVVTGASF